MRPESVRPWNPCSWRRLPDQGPWGQPLRSIWINEWKAEARNRVTRPLPFLCHRKNKPSDFSRLDLGTNMPPQTEKETICGQVQVSPLSRAIQLPSLQLQHSHRIMALACSPDFGPLWTEATSGHMFPKSASCVLSPLRVPFQTVILFSRDCPPMNYPKSILFWPPVPHTRKVGNP